MQMAYPGIPGSRDRGLMSSRAEVQGRGEVRALRLREPVSTPPWFEQTAFLEDCELKLWEELARARVSGITEGINVSISGFPIWRPVSSKTPAPRGWLD